MPDGASLLEARNISKQYGGRQIIKNICIRLEKGELISLLGLSGSGKTTLFHVLSGLTVPEEGSVFLEGRDITGMPGSVSYMLQKDLLLAHKKVIDNVSLPLVLRGAKKKDARAAADPLFSQFGLDGTQYLYPSQLSGGMRQRAALLRTYLSSLKDDACAMKSSAAQTHATLRDNASSAGVGKAPAVQKSGSSSGGVALLDEPFSALDTITKSQIHTWYLDVMQKISLSTIFITHDIDEAILLSDRIYIMTGAPGVVTNEIRILPPRPQRREFNLTSEFLDYKRQIIHILGQDV